MTRKSIFEILEGKYDINYELYQIDSLYRGNTLYYAPTIGRKRFLSLDDLVDQVFHKWKSKGTCTSCLNMRQRLGISEILPNTKFSEEKIVLYLEYYSNTLYLYSTKIRLPDEVEELNTLSMLRDNIDSLIEHIHYKKHICKNDECVLLIPNDPAATAVAEIAPENIAFAILKYNHASLKGQLEEKRRLLQSIANEYETLLKNPVAGFTEYFTTTRGLLNNLNIRHNNTESNLLKTMSPEDLETWYDELYQLLLFCVLAKDNSERKKLAAELLKTKKGQ